MLKVSVRRRRSKPVEVTSQTPQKSQGEVSPPSRSTSFKGGSSVTRTREWRITGGKQKGKLNTHINPNPQKVEEKTREREAAKVREWKQSRELLVMTALAFQQRPKFDSAAFKALLPYGYVRWKIPRA